MKRALVIAASLLVAASAAAAPRFHLLTPALRGRLSSPTDLVVGAVGQVDNDATGFLVQRTGRRGLLLTNEHVAGHGLPPGEPITFLDGTIAHAQRLVAKDAVHDYALVEISFPGWHEGMPLSLQPGPVPASHPIYSVAGYARLRFNAPGSGLNGSAATRAAVARRPWGHFAIAVGKTGTGPMHATWVRLDDTRIKGVRAELPNTPGMSGSPILDRSTHRVIGLHSGGNAKPNAWNEFFVPIGNILRDVRTKLADGKLPVEAEPLVRDLLR